MNEQGTRHLVDHWLWLVVTWDEENKCVQKYIIFPQLWCNKRIYDCWIIIFFVLQEKSFQNISISCLHLSKVDRSLRYLKFNEADTYINGTLFFSQSIRSALRPISVLEVVKWNIGIFLLLLKIVMNFRRWDALVLKRFLQIL